MARHGWRCLLPKSARSPRQSVRLVPSLSSLPLCTGEKVSQVFFSVGFVPPPHYIFHRYTLFPVPDGAEGGGGSGSTSGLDPDSLAMTIAAPRRRSSVGHHRTSSTAMASAPPSHHHPIFTPVGREPRGDHFRTPSGLSSSMLPLGSMSTGAVRGTPTPRASIIGRHVEEAPSQPLPTFPMASTAGMVLRLSLL
jgi:hypothetical protein